MNKKRVQRLYRDEGLTVRLQRRRKRASHLRILLPPPRKANVQGSMDFVVALVLDGRRFRALTVVDTLTRTCQFIEVDAGLTGAKVVAALERVVRQTGYPQMITVDTGSEFASNALDAWAYAHRVTLDCIRPGKPVENGFIERVNGRLRDECVTVEVCFTLDDARENLVRWQQDYHLARPHRALDDRAPASFAAAWSDPTQTIQAPDTVREALT